MRRFDFLRDGLPDALEAFLAFRIPRRLRTAAASAAAAACIVAAAAGLEALRVRSALDVQARQQQRFEQSERRLAAARLQWQDVQRMAAAARRLLQVRDSGARVAARLAIVGNLVPRGAWLSEITPGAAGLSVRGAAIDLSAVDRTLGNFAHDPHLRFARLVSASLQPRAAAPPLVSFEVDVEAVP